MKTDCKRYKFINSTTGNTLYYHSFDEQLEEAVLKEELEKIKAQVAVSNGLFLGIVYWEEMK